MRKKSRQQQLGLAITATSWRVLHQGRIGRRPAIKASTQSLGSAGGNHRPSMQGTEAHWGKWGPRPLRARERPHRGNPKRLWRPWTPRRRYCNSPEGRERRPAATQALARWRRRNGASRRLAVQGASRQPQPLSVHDADAGEEVTFDFHAEEASRFAESDRSAKQFRIQNHGIELWTATSFDLAILLATSMLHWCRPCFGCSRLVLRASSAIQHS